VAYFRIMSDVSLETEDRHKIFWQRHVSLREVIMSILTRLVINLEVTQVTYLYLTSNVFILSKQINDRSLNMFCKFIFSHSPDFFIFKNKLTTKSIRGQYNSLQEDLLTYCL
jgi:hypothetical protein